MLTETLALANPTAFGRANRMKQRAGEIADQLGTPQRWKMEMAAMLSQVACVTVPDETLDRLYSGEELSASDQAIVDRLPEVAEALLADIPRIEDVRAILHYSHVSFDADAQTRKGVPVGAQILRVVLDYDLLESRGVPQEAALEALRGRPGAYNSEILLALGRLPEAEEADEEIREVPILGLRKGMVLIDPVETVDGRLLVARGQEVSAGMVERLRNFSANVEVKEPLRVLVLLGGVREAERAAAAE